MKIKNLPDNGILRFMVVRISNGEFWYYDSYRSPKEANDMAKKVLGAVMKDHIPEVNHMPLNSKHYKYVIVRVAGGMFQYYGVENNWDRANLIARSIRGGVLHRREIRD